MIRIDITPVELSAQKPTEVLESYMELHPNHLKYRLKFKADEPVDREDPGLGWEELITDFCVVVKREHVSSLEKEYLNNSDKYMIDMSIIGAANDIKAMFHTHKEALVVYNKLESWLLGTLHFPVSDT